jgi:hypothetical protein
VWYSSSRWTFFVWAGSAQGATSEDDSGLFEREEGRGRKGGTREDEEGTREGEGVKSARGQVGFLYSSTR